jgi:DNA-binding HxlR family transcriptional regulator
MNELRVGDRYALLVAREIRYGYPRFQDIAASTGAPRDVLTAGLRKLEQAGVIERRQYSERPPRHEYLLTNAGRDLQPILLALKEWGDRYVNVGAEPVIFRTVQIRAGQQALTAADPLPEDLREALAKINPLDRAH